MALEEDGDNQRLYLAWSLQVEAGEMVGVEDGTFGQWQDYTALNILATIDRPTSGSFRL